MLVYSSSYTVTSALALNGKTYSCKMYVDSIRFVVSTLATLYVVGKEGASATFPGDFWESDASGDGLWSEDGTVSFMVKLFNGFACNSPPENCILI